MIASGSMIMTVTVCSLAPASWVFWQRGLAAFAMYLAVILIIAGMTADG